MKIAYIGQKGIPVKTGGVERYVEEVAIRMADLGHEVFVYARNNYTDKKIKQYKGVNIINLPSIPTKNLDAISHTFLASMHALFQDYDVIHYSSIGPTSLSVIPRFLKDETAIVSTFQCQDYLHQKWGRIARAYLRFSEWLTCIIPNKTIAVSEVLCKYSKEKYGRELAWIPNGTTFRFNQEDDFLRSIGTEKNGYILSASRLVRHKGVHYLIKAFNNLCNQKLNQGKKLVIAGDGAYTDDYVNELHELAKDNPEIICTGNVTGSTLEQLFSHCYLFVQPSETEGLSLALLEAMGYGRAILISNIPENLEAMKGTGFVFENMDEKDLEKQLQRIIENPQLAEAAGKESFSVAERHYTWGSIVSQIEKIYAELSDEKKGVEKTIVLTYAQRK